MATTKPKRKGTMKGDTITGGTSTATAVVTVIYSQGLLGFDTGSGLRANQKS